VVDREGERRGEKVREGRGREEEEKRGLEVKPF